MKKMDDDQSARGQYLIEVAWEVCNQVGGIHTVIKSKIPAMKERWGENYLLVGPYIREQAASCFEQITNPNLYKTAIGQTVKYLQGEGFEVYLGHWLVTGRPLVVLLNPYSMLPHLDRIKYYMWEHHHISTVGADQVLNDALMFGGIIKLFLDSLMSQKNRPEQIITHFHEWMAASCIPDIRRDNLPVATVFTTHATILARYLAPHDDNFYNNLPYYNWEYEANRLLIAPHVNIERAAAHGAHVFTTVSHVTAKECAHLLGRTPDSTLPNGLNIERFTALHEFQNLHQRYKLQINEFIAGHFFSSYTFDLDNTLYFFTSGRYEFRNKGFDLTLETLRRLNYRMQEENIDKTVVMFFITRRPNKGVLADVLQKRAMMTEIKRNCDGIEKQIGENLFNALVSSKDHRIPDLNAFIDESSKMRLRRQLQTWRSNGLPTVVTHDLWDNTNDEILNFIRYHNLVNSESDKVKIIYHPEFLTPSSPLLPLEYEQFVRGCHLGLFLSSYEPWGYTPLECVASGVPAVTTDLAGFGDYVLTNDIKNIHVVNRTSLNFNGSVDQTVEYLLNFVRQGRRSRIDFRNRVEATSPAFDWSTLITHYWQTYELVSSRAFAVSARLPEADVGT
jgi:glycogen(starch) synthase